jgi:hypothetical protein
MTDRPAADTSLYVIDPSGGGPGQSEPAAAKSARYSASVRSRPVRVVSMFTSWDLANDGALPRGTSNSTTSGGARMRVMAPSLRKCDGSLSDDNALRQCVGLAGGSFCIDAPAIAPPLERDAALSWLATIGVQVHRLLWACTETASDRGPALPLAIVSHELVA